MQGGRTSAGAPASDDEEKGGKESVLSAAADADASDRLLSAVCSL